MNICLEIILLQNETFSVLLVEYLKDVFREALIDFKESDLKKDL